MQLTEEEILARLAEVEAEIADLEDLEFEEGLRYAVDEGFIRVEQDEDGEFSFWPVDEAHYIEVPE